MARWSVIAAAAALGLGLAGCGGAGDTGNNSITAAADQPRMLKALNGAQGLDATARLVKEAGFDRMFDGVGSYTLFAPTDAAIAALPDADRQRLESADGRPQLIALLRQHVVPGYIGRADIDEGLARKDGSVRLATVGSEPLTLRKQGDAVVIGDGADAPRLAGPAIATRNGVIFPIDRVLPPPAAR